MLLLCCGCASITITLGATRPQGGGLSALAGYVHAPLHAHVSMSVQIYGWVAYMRDHGAASSRRGSWPTYPYLTCPCSRFPSLCVPLQADAAVVHAAPLRILLVPLLLFLLTCGLGLFGVLMAADQRISQDKGTAKSGIATETTSSFKLQLEVTQTATAALVAYVREQPSCTGLDASFRSLAKSSYEWVSARLWLLAAMRSAPSVLSCRCTLSTTTGADMGH